MSQLTTCSNHGGHSQPSSILCLYGERHQDVKDPEPSAYRSFGVLLIEAHIDYQNVMWEEFTHQSTTSQKIRGICTEQAQGKKNATIILNPNCKASTIPSGRRSERSLIPPAPKPSKPARQNQTKTINKQPRNQSIRPKAASKKPKPAPAKPQEKKRKPVSESSEAPPLAKWVPTAKPSLEDTEEAILQKVLQESLTDAYPTQRGPLPPVVFRETDTGKFQPLPEVPGKGKEKVGEEQAAQSDEEMPSVVRSGAQDEGQAGPDPGSLDEGQARPNPDDVAESQPLPTPSVSR
ncbi:hypothetical protein Tco_0968777 [Tanacetum coccineum]